MEDWILTQNILSSCIQVGGRARSEAGGDIVLQDNVQSGASGFSRNLHVGTLNSMRRKVGKECASCDYVFRSDCNSRSVNRRRILSKHCVARQCGFRSYVSADSGLFACSRSTFLLLFGGCTYCIGEGD
jgi:hypothetical protein